MNKIQFGTKTHDEMVEWCKKNVGISVHPVGVTHSRYSMCAYKGPDGEVYVEGPTSEQCEQFNHWRIAEWSLPKYTAIAKKPQAATNEIKNYKYMDSPEYFHYPDGFSTGSGCKYVRAPVEIPPNPCATIPTYVNPLRYARFLQTVDRWETEAEVVERMSKVLWSEDVDNS